MLNYIICSQSQIISESGWSSSFQMIGQLVLLIVVFAAILFLAYFSTKKIASFKLGTGRNNFFKIVSSLPLGGTNSIQLVKAGERYFLIGVSKEKIVCIAEFQAEDISDFDADNVKPSFQKYFDNFLNKNKNNELNKSNNNEFDDNKPDNDKSNDK